MVNHTGWILYTPHSFLTCREQLVLNFVSAGLDEIPTWENLMKKNTANTVLNTVLNEISYDMTMRLRGLVRAGRWSIERGTYRESPLVLRTTVPDDCCASWVNWSSALILFRNGLQGAGVSNDRKDCPRPCRSLSLSWEEWAVSDWGALWHVFVHDVGDHNARPRWIYYLVWRVGTARRTQQAATFALMKQHEHSSLRLASLLPVCYMMK